ncbi:winged helix-turn-helix domain-containing protein [Haladaptatus cibarius]|uniref:winged helix-turn-helix domain-containing protein n=1 Tax=Haladaptatus cibarius TaxID=453847 RepID=UPI001B801B49|nr:winged helix-turn-helix domain-containing protein [Haladaptatus cibarius]
MRPDLASWMTPVDRSILELLRNEEGQELVLTPGLIAENTDWKRQTVREHVALLLEHELVEYHDESRAIYRLSDKGRQYLAGDLSADELEND